MTAKELLTKVKALFEAAPPAAPADTDTSTVFSFLVDGGATIYVDCSADGAPGIDSGDKVYSDPAMTIPYPDGTYNVTGTTFGFTVSSGAVATITDASGTGPGTPIEQAPAAPAAAAAPPAAPVPPAAPAAPAPVPPAAPAPPPAAPAAPAVPAGPTNEELAARITALEAAIAKLTPPPVTTGMATQVALQAATQKVDKHEAVIAGLFEIVEELTKVPSVDPVTLVGNKKDKFEALQASKDAKIEGIAAQVKKLREAKNK